MGLFKSKSNSVKKHDDRSNGGRKKVKYVWVSSRKAIFIITGEPRESKYSYSVPIIPLHGIYYSSKDKRKYTAKELSDYFVVLNIDEEDADALKGKKVVVMGYNDNEMLLITANGGDEKNGDNKA
jgi:ABC-type amino acid transport substrate-binding protein